MDAVIDRLQRTRVLEIVGLHRIGEDELSARLEHPRHLVQHRLAIGRMQDRILAPHRIEAIRLEGQIVERAVDHLDLRVETGFLGQRAVALVLDRGEVEAGDMRAMLFGQHARRPAEAGADIEHALALEIAQLGDDAIDRGAARAADILGRVVEADMDVLAAPDGGVEIVGILAVVIVARGVDARGLDVATCRHRSSPQREQRNRDRFPRLPPGSRHRNGSAGSRHPAAGRADSSSSAGTC